MKANLIVNSGSEQIAKEELKEKINVDSKIFNSVVEFSTSAEDILKFVKQYQAGRRLIISLDQKKEVDSLAVSEKLSSYFDKGVKFKVVVEGVKGQENRTAIAKVVAGKIFAKLEEEGIKANLELKTPEFLVIVYFNGEDYFLGIDLIGKELDSREYRVFTSSASFKGDLGYALIKKSQFNINEKALFGFVKDGTLAIEAALWANKFNLLNKMKYSFSGMSAFKDLKEEKSTQGGVKIFATDSNIGNVNACRRNSSLAKVKDFITVQKFSLEDWDVKFDENEFDLVVVQITTKDEDRINEIYYQTSYLLKTGGRVMVVGRTNWDLSISDKFKLIESGELVKGESKHKYWLLERV
jgi:23S rRNA G2445 N2-methylase RlmL